MSLMKFRRRMASKQTATIILWVLILVFMAGIVMWNVPGGRLNQNGQGSTGTGEVIAVVNGEKVTSDELDKRFQDAINQGAPSDIESVLAQRNNVFNTILQERVAQQVMRGLKTKYSSKVAKAIATEYAESQLIDMRKYAQSEYDAALAQAKTDEAKAKVKSVDETFNKNLSDAMQRMGATPPAKVKEQDFTDFFVNDYVMKEGTQVFEQFKQHVITRTIGKALIKQLPVDPTTEDFAKRLSMEEVHAKWIFADAKEKSKAGLDKAKEKATSLREAVLKDPGQFAELAKKNSDHFMTATQGGDLGWIRGGDFSMPLMAEYLAYTQKKGELGPVTQINIANQASQGASQVGYGFVSVLDARKRTDQPKDYDWAKERARSMLLVRQRYETTLGENYLSFMLVQADLLPKAKEAEIYVLESRGEYTKADQIRDTVLNTPAEKDKLPAVIAAAFCFKAARATNDLQKRVDYLNGAMQQAGTKAPELFMMMGDAYAGLKNKEKALESYTNALESAASGQGMLVEQLRQKFTDLGDKVSAKKVDEWLKTNADAGGNMAMPPMR